MKAKVKKKAAAPSPAERVRRLRHAPTKLKVEGTMPYDPRSLWQLSKHGVSQSFIGKFLACREHARLSFCEGWTSKLPSKPREFGSCGHWILKQI